MLISMSEELSSELKKEQIRTYFKESGVIDKIADIFDKLASTKPSNPLDFIREELGVKPIPLDKIKEMEHELDDAHREKRRLRGVLKKLGVDNIDERLDLAVTGPKDFETSADLEASIVSDFRNENEEVGEEES